VHNPRSNMNNNVGHAPLHLFGERVALGTDGFPADMFEEARFGFLRKQENRKKLQAHASGKESPFTRFVSGGHELVSEIFREKFGSFEKGALADFVVLNYVPPTPLTEENLFWHFLFGTRSAMIDSVMVGGRWVMKDGLVLGVNTEEACKKASEAAIRLWKRMNG